MAENLFEHMPELERLMETRSFGELTLVEREQVLRNVSEEEYESCRAVILAGKLEFGQEKKALVPDPAIRERLLRSMGGSEASQMRVMDHFMRFLGFRIPVYQPVMAAACLAILFIFLYNRKPETVRYLVSTDTVYMEKPVAAKHSPVPSGLMAEHHVTFAPGKTGRLKPTPVPSQARKRAFIPQDQFVENAYQKIELAGQLKAGHTASDDSVLMRFLVAAN